MNTGISALERRLGDPWDPANPLGHEAILAADERAEMFADGERALDDHALNAEFVPASLGGRMTGLDRLIRVMRSVFRRDPCLGLGYGASTFIASVNVWAGGSDAQRGRLAELLLGGDQVASVYHELAHGNDFARVDFRALPDGAGNLVLSGRKEVVTNARRCTAMVIFSRTAASGGGRSHTQLLVEKAALPAGRMRYVPRFSSTGMRGVQLGGVEFTDCPVPESVAIGPLGSAMEIALRSFQLTRTGLPAMALGVLDTGLRAALRGSGDRVLYGRPVTAMPHTRAVLAEAFVDLLLSDCLATVVARSVHLLPDQSNAYASAAKYVVSGRAMAAMYRLSQLLGAQFYVRTGPVGIFQKLVRDLAPAGFGHAARVACLATVLPQLPRLARRSWSASDTAPPALFRLDDPLPPLPFAALTVSSARDTLAGALAAVRERLPADAGAELRELAAAFAGELVALRAAVAEVRPHDLAVGGDPAALDLAARYATVLAASACLNVWLANRDHAGFTGDPRWVTAALLRLAADVGRGSGALPDHLVEPLYAELSARYAAAHSFDLSRVDLPG
ncbi:acyl-CoA dehydrogenase [Phytohabitans rumicis]|uniref:Acyl-CoA dehydrogenase n=1 Tax=Phytohabitans rumicis TaxID=1076125 RepID=A0A6V8KSD4_9ACTN|nr:acyl-CoA dehydrogenase [Phytohabitans rumicis]GFJ86754.1 acyl-CoA dehydrogenase [Phytohabitans rumicis]